MGRWSGGRAENPAGLRPLHALFEYKTSVMINPATEQLHSGCSKVVESPLPSACTFDIIH